MIEDDKLEHSDINVQFPNGLSITSQASLGVNPWWLFFSADFTGIIVLTSICAEWFKIQIQIQAI